MTTKPIRILIVEDSITDSALIQRQLEKIFTEPEIRVSDSLLNVRYTAKTFFPEMVFTDYDLDGFTGEDVLLTFKELFPRIPIIVITGTLNSEELAANAILNGASGFFLKKNMNELADRMKPVINKILTERKEFFERMEEEQKRRDKLQRVHALLKEASKPTDQENVKEYYEKLLKEISDNLDTIIK
ncbi:response regulator [Mangrovimonas sp. ST2L15]|uniref:response regulator n=1 Tax=Mangrovimonas sp. ST2L15 TaxID=1645916 RepID=UPI0006B50C89|nr:response regulator [Mangrovimonas sp. ST2L15]